MTCWVQIVAEEAYAMYEKYKLTEVMRKMINRPSFFKAGVYKEMARVKNLKDPKILNPFL